MLELVSAYLWNRCCWFTEGNLKVVLLVVSWESEGEKGCCASGEIVNSDVSTESLWVVAGVGSSRHGSR